MRTALAGLVAAGLALSGCGTRVDDAELRAGAGATTVNLSPETIKALTEISGAGGALRAPTGPASEAPPASTNPATSVDGESGPAQQATPDAHNQASLAASRDSTAQGRTTTVAAGAECQAELAPIPVGQVGTFSGLLGPITGSMQIALAAWARDLNSRGGIACHPIEVHSADDGADGARSAYLVQDMAERHHVVAFVGNAIVFPAGFHQAIARAKTPAVGGPGFQSWRDSPWVFPESASAADQIFGLIRSGVEQGKRKLGLIHCVEASQCAEAANDFKVNAPAAGAELVYSTPASVTQTDYTAGCLNARNAGVDQLAVGLDGASISRLARSCQAIGYRPLLSSLAALISPGNAKDPLVQEFGLATATGTAPWTLTDTPGLRDYHRVLERWAPSTPADGASLIAFTSGKLFEKALANVAADMSRGPVTPALVLSGLGGIRNEALGGLTVGLTFRPGQERSLSSGCVFVELLTTSGWTAPKGSRPVCRPG